MEPITCVNELCDICEKYICDMRNIICIYVLCDMYMINIIGDSCVGSLSIITYPLLTFLQLQQRLHFYLEKIFISFDYIKTSTIYSH